MRELSPSLAGHYDEMYAEGRSQTWRDLGAKDKSSNIVRAWSAVANPRPPSVIEIGCGEGAVAAALAEHRFFSDYRGYDISRSGIQQALARSIPGAHFVRIAGSAIPAEADSAELVVMSHVVEHLEHPRTLLLEAIRLAPWTIIEVPLELNLRTPVNYVPDALGHINKYNAVSIRHLVQSVGFRVVHQFTTNPSLAVARFTDDSLRRSAAWSVKQLLLRALPPIARGLFTYHETLLARRP